MKPLWAIQKGLMNDFDSVGMKEALDSNAIPFLYCERKTPTKLAFRQFCLTFRFGDVSELLENILKYKEDFHMILWYNNSNNI